MFKEQKNTNSLLQSQLKEKGKECETLCKKIETEHKKVERLMEENAKLRMPSSSGKNSTARRTKDKGDSTMEEKLLFENEKSDFKIREHYMKLKLNQVANDQKKSSKK